MTGKTPAAAAIETATFEDTDPRLRGRAHGETWRAEIRDLVEIRMELLGRFGALGARPEIGETATRHLAVLEQYLPDLREEMKGIAEGAGASIQQIVVVNHYTDLVELGAAATRTDPGGATAIYLSGDQGPLLGQTWDMHASAERFVRLIRIRPRGTRAETVCFTLTGCLGMAGVGPQGVAVTTAQLHVATGLGLVWPALVRHLLAQPSASAAYAALQRAPLGAGRYFMLADGQEFFGVECGTATKVRTQTGAKAAHLHTNHCFDPVLRKQERLSNEGTTFERMNLASTLYAQLRPRTLEALWELLSSHDGYPRSICSHADADSDPSSSRTCGLFAAELQTGRIRAARGCGRSGTHVDLRVERSLEP